MMSPTENGGAPVGSMSPSRPARRIPAAVFIAIGIAAVGVSLAMLFGGLDRLVVGILSIVLLLLIMAAGVPIGIAMIAASMVGLLAITSPRAAASSLQSIMFDGVASWTLSVVPLFILMGIAIWRGGISTRAYRAASQWFGRAPGGLGVATNLAGATLASSSGSTIGISFALGRMAIPEMLKAGYSPKVATSSVAMAGALGQIIPPSILLVIYAGVASVPVGPQLLAGIVPGIVLAVAFSLTVVAWALLRPGDAPRAEQSDVTWGTRFRSLLGLIPVLLIVVVVLGGMFTGVFTATEAAACGTVVAIVVAIVTAAKSDRGLRGTFTFLREIVMNTVGSVASLMIVVVGALLLGRIIALSGLAQELTAWLVGLDLSRIELLLVLILVYLILGMFLESLPMILLTVPLLAAPLQAVGVDMIWFGVFLVILTEIGMVFPPIGLLTFIVHRLAQDPQVNLGTRVKLTDVFAGVMPFVAVALGVLVLFIFFPEIVLWLPEASRAG